MIAENELRIGIDVLKDGKIKHVTIFTLIDIVNFNSHFEPIILSPEILLQCGFEKSEYNKQEQWLSRVITRHNPYSEYRIGLMARPFGYTYEEAIVKIIVSYLHQLQNLFFCLTGEELEITKITL